MKTRWVDNGGCCLLLRRGQETRIPTTLRNRSPPSTLRDSSLPPKITSFYRCCLPFHSISRICFRRNYYPSIREQHPKNTQRAQVLLFSKRRDHVPEHCRPFERSQESIIADQIGAAGDFSLSSRHLRFPGEHLPRLETCETPKPAVCHPPGPDQQRPPACVSRFTLTIPCEHSG